MMKKVIPWLIVAAGIAIAGQLQTFVGDPNWLKQCSAIAISIIFILISLAPDYRDDTASLRFHGSVLVTCGIVAVAASLLQHEDATSYAILYYGGIASTTIGLLSFLVAINKQRDLATVLKCLGTLGTVGGYAVALLLGAW